MNSVLLVVLGLSLLVDLALGAWAGANFPHFAETWGLGDLAAGGAAGFLGWVLATCLVGFAAIQGLAFRWTRRDRDEGPQLAIVFGCWLVLSAVATFAFASTHGLAPLGVKFLVVDGLRGAALTVVGLLTLHAPSVVRELRLPDAARQARRREERPERLHAERRDDRPRRRDEGRDDRGRSRARRDGQGRGDRQHQGRRREEPSRGARPLAEGRRPTPPGGAAVVADLERRAVAEARRILPDSAEHPLTVVVKGAPERIRALAADEGRVAEVYPVGPLVTDSALAGDGNGRRRRRRRRRGGSGTSDAPLEQNTAEAAFNEGADDLDEPAVVEREIEERADEGSGEAQEGISAVRGRSRRRRRRPGPSGPSEVGSDSGGEPEPRPEPRHASAVEALDVLRLLEPKDSGSSAPSRSADSQAFGRTYRPAGPRRAGAPRHPEDG
jgi:hypothetical protein